MGLCEIEVGRHNNFVSKNNEEIQNYLPAAHTTGQRGLLLVPEKSWFGERKDSLNSTLYYKFFTSYYLLHTEQITCLIQRATAGLLSTVTC